MSRLRPTEIVERAEREKRQQGEEFAMLVGHEITDAGAARGGNAGTRLSFQLASMKGRPGLCHVTT